ncbi:hypothetical protein Barb7_02333 [Bacteroidales bacterium Barb7]|nr:hypothetical protein Barb7_02333 [Bacteroidales bacterium Barb7]
MILWCSYQAAQLVFGNIKDNTPFVSVAYGYRQRLYSVIIIRTAPKGKACREKQYSCC